MGYPAKSYELFRRLGETLSGEGRQHHFEITRLLSQYSIQSFFIYDPVKDPEFARKLENDFMFFDRLTGQRMMFMCLLKGDYRHEGARYRYYDFFDQASWTGHKPASPVTDISLATQLLCSELGLDYKYSPYLVFTTDFRNDWLFAAELSAENVEQTMQLMSSMAMQMPIACTEEDLKLYLLRHAMPLHEQLLYRKYQKTLTRKLMHFLERTDKEQTSIPERQRAFERSFIYKINSASAFFRNHLSEKPDTASQLWEEKYLQQIAGELALSLKMEAEDVSPMTSMQSNYRPESSKIEPQNYIPSTVHIGRTNIETEGMEQESKNLLEICALLERNFLRTSTGIKDYSFFTVNLSKCFEIELNHSIGQLVRKQDGIEMPDYFYKLKPDGNKHFYMPDNLPIRNASPIPLNMAKERHHWLPPGMGQTKIVWNSMKLRFPDFHKKLVPYFPDERFEINWQRIHEIRNKTSHTQMVSLKEKDAMLEAMYNLSTTRCLEGIQSIKQKLKEPKDRSTPGSPS